MKGTQACYILFNLPMHSVSIRYLRYLALLSSFNLSQKNWHYSLELYKEAMEYVQSFAGVPFQGNLNSTKHALLLHMLAPPLISHMTSGK